MEQEYDNHAEVYSVLKKGFFFFAILGCIGVYLRMNSKKDRRHHKKSLA